MKRKVLDLIIFLISVICLVISICLFWNMGVFVDEYNTTPTAICGGTFGLLADWGRIFLLFILSILSAVKLFKKKRK